MDALDTPDHDAVLAAISTVMDPEAGMNVVDLGLILHGVGGYNTFAYIALQSTTATNAVLLNSLIPVATIAISCAFLGKHPRRLEAIRVAISLLGALTIVARGDPAILLHLNLNVGDVWMLAAVLIWAI